MVAELGRDAGARGLGGLTGPRPRCCPTRRHDTIYEEVFTVRFQRRAGGYVHEGVSDTPGGRYVACVDFLGPDGTASAGDKPSYFGSEGWGFESSR